MTLVIYINKLRENTSSPSPNHHRFKTVKQKFHPAHIPSPKSPLPCPTFHSNLAPRCGKLWSARAVFLPCRTSITIITLCNKINEAILRYYATLVVFATSSSAILRKSVAEFCVGPRRFCLSSGGKTIKSRKS